MATEIWVGSAVRFSTTVKNAAGTLVDPTNLKITITTPQGGTKVYVYLTDNELVKDSTGTYHCDHVITGGTGFAKWKWLAEGTNAGADQGEFTVLK